LQEKGRLILHLLRLSRTFTPIARGLRKRQNIELRSEKNPLNLMRVMPP
jgi:hypothetical protein